MKGKFLLKIRKIPPQKTDTRSQNQFFELCPEEAHTILLTEGEHLAFVRLNFVILMTSTLSCFSSEKKQQKGKFQVATNGDIPAPMS